MVERPAPQAEYMAPEDVAGSERRLATLRRLEKLAYALDRQFSIGGMRFGWDGLIGLVPGIGDTATLAMSGWLIYEAHRLGVPGSLKARMAANAGIDYGIGLVPLVGDLADFAFKANTRNLRLLKEHLEEEERRSNRRI